MSRQILIKMHFLLASFLMTIAMMFLISGALYTLDIKGDIEKKVVVIKLDKPFAPNLDDLGEATVQALAKRNLPQPKGEMLLRKKKGKYELRWSDLRYAVKLQEAKTPNKAVLTFRERSILTQFMRVHRADAGTIFKGFALALAVGLLMIFASGVYLAYSVPKYRKPMGLAIGLGFISFFTLIYIT